MAKRENTMRAKEQKRETYNNTNPGPVADVDAHTGQQEDTNTYSINEEAARENQGESLEEAMAAALVSQSIAFALQTGYPMRRYHMLEWLRVNHKLFGVDWDDPVINAAVTQAEWLYKYNVTERMGGKPATYASMMHDIWFRILSAMHLTNERGQTLDAINPLISIREAIQNEIVNITDDDLDKVFPEMERISEQIWRGRQAMPVKAVVYDLIDGICRSADPESLSRLAWAMASAMFNPLTPIDRGGRSGMPAPTPKELYALLDKNVQGQEEAKKAAAMVMWHYFKGERTNVVFCGPTGCGKSEIWRVLAREYPGAVRMVDFSRMCGEGWHGGVHLRDIFDGLEPRTLAENGLVVVLDEADKILCETAIGSGGTNHNAIIQNNLLKLLDGDVVEFGPEPGRQDSFQVDCKNVSVVILGAFEKLMEAKSRKSVGLGFNQNVSRNRGYEDMDVTYEDLIAAGTRREIAGRINRIVALSPLSRDDYAAILRKFIVPGLSAPDRKVVLDTKFAGKLVDDAIESKLGVRWMRSRVSDKLDDLIFDKPDKKSYRIAE